jgi:ribosome-associated protein
MIIISNKIQIPDNEIDMNAILSQGSGGQNVNKVSTAVHLRFDINKSSLPSFYKEQLLKLKDSRLTKDGVIIIKSQSYRSYEKNKEEAIERLIKLIKKAVKTLKKRRATKPTFGSKEKRLNKKTKHSGLKSLRKKVDY